MPSWRLCRPGQAFRVFGVALERRPLAALDRAPAGSSNCGHCCAACGGTHRHSTCSPAISIHWRRARRSRRGGCRCDCARCPWATGGRCRWRTVKSRRGRALDAFRTLHPDEPGYTMPTWDSACAPRLRLRAGGQLGPPALPARSVAHADAAAGVGSPSRASRISGGRADATCSTRSNARRRSKLSEGSDVTRAWPGTDALVEFVEKLGVAARIDQAPRR